MNADELCESIEFLCNSPQRLRILDALAERQMDVRDLMGVLDSPRSTLQHNLTVLEDRGCIEQGCSGYTRTTVGGLLREEFVTVGETTATIKRMAPFFEAVDESPEIDVGQLTNVRVTTPDPARPNVPTKRLFEAFEGADHVQGFVPVVSCFVVELFCHEDRNITEHDYIISEDTFDMLHEQYADEWIEESEKLHYNRLKLRLYEGNLPYGLFVSQNRLVLTAYNESGRMQALVESTTEEAVEWGERMYETYRRESTESEITTSSVAHSAEPMD